MTAILGAVVVFLLCLLGIVQFASDAIFASAAVPGSLPSHLRPETGEAIYRAIARVAPAPYVNSMLAYAAFDRGDLDAARRYALALPPSNRRSDVLGRIALARGDVRGALRYFIQANDSDAVDAQVAILRKTDLPAAYALESKLKDRLERESTHPDALAQAYWRLGTLAIAQGKPQLALQNYGRAVQISPLSERYLLWAGYQAYDLNLLDEAGMYFDRAVSADPTSADAYAGHGLVALRRGDRATAISDEARARARNPHALGFLRLQSALR
ncbi:MAG TPA: tetratricopeptide repeat protein [Candidatus Baltobacteraceae bacterium]|nr:tetratricopeptide repeat protein [Candidatus Baltobacteraceae bacterium]